MNTNETKITALLLAAQDNLAARRQSKARINILRTIVKSADNSDVIAQENELIERASALYLNK